MRPPIVYLSARKLQRTATRNPETLRRMQVLIAAVSALHCIKSQLLFALRALDHVILARCPPQIMCLSWVYSSLMSWQFLGKTSVSGPRVTIGTPEESEKSPERAPGRRTQKSRKSAPRSLKRVRKESENQLLDSFQTLLRLRGRTLSGLWGSCARVLFPHSLRTPPGFRARIGSGQMGSYANGVGRT